MKNQKRVKRKKFYVTSLVLPNYHAYKKDVNGYKTPVTAFQMTSLNWQRSVSVKRTRKEKLNLSQPAYIGERSLPLLFKSINSNI